MTDKVTKLHPRCPACDGTQLSDYNRMLIDLATAEPEHLGYQPEAHCVVSTGPSPEQTPDAMWDVDTLDYPALLQLVGILERVKAAAILRMGELEALAAGGDGG